jgi:predicted phosphatase
MKGEWGCQGKFVYIVSPEIYKKYYNKGAYKILPKSLLTKLVNNTKPKILCRYTEGKNDEIKGYGVGAFITYKSVSKSRLINRLIETINSLVEENVTKLCLNDLHLLTIEDMLEIEEQCKIKVVNGKSIKVKLVWYIIKRICKYNNIELKEQEILVISDEIGYLKELVYTMAKELKYISILTHYNEHIKKLVNDIFLNIGLSIHVTNSVSKSISKYNVIINLKNNIELKANDIKKKAIVFDLSNSKRLSNNIRDLRKDIMVISDFIFRRPNELLCDVEDYNFMKEIPSHIYEIIRDIDQTDCIKVVIGNKRYTIKEISQLFLKGDSVCRHVSINVKNKTTLDS